MKLTTLWYRELRRYSADRLRKDFGDQGQAIIDQLVRANILRHVKRGQDDPRIDEMLELTPEDEPMLAFNYCGVLLVGDILIRCYPKYIRQSDQKKKSFPLVLQAIRKYERHHYQYLNISKSGSRITNQLSIILAIIEDYRQNGLYRVVDTERELNGEGETDWRETIESLQPAFLKTRQGKQPLYINRKTFRRRTDEENFFRQVQMAILNECCTTIRKLELTEMISVRGIRFDGIRLKDLGSRRYIQKKLEQEIPRQFHEQRRTILKLLVMYLTQKSKRKKESSIIFFGTNAMHSIWERALADVLDNQLSTVIRNIAGLKSELINQYENKDRRLIEIIEKPKWIVWHNEETVRVQTDTLIPDTIAIHDNTFFIYDAKYYTPKITDEKITGQPGLESITKQYLYHMAYKGFLDYFQISNVKNVFLIPHEQLGNGVVSQPLGKVMFDLLGQYTGVDVEALYLDADVVWKAYVKGEKIPIGDLSWT